MFIKPKRVKKDITFFKRKGEIKITQQEIDRLNRDIIKRCKEKGKRIVYKED